MGSDDEATKLHLSHDDYFIIVCWMENETNFDMIHGSAKKTTVGAKVTKEEAFKLLAEHLHEETTTPNFPLLSGKSMNRRWNTYKQKFTKALDAKRSRTGMGLSAKEIKQGLTFPGKLEKMCPHFSRMKNLFGEKANVSAAGTTEIGAVVNKPEDEEEELTNSSRGDASPEFRFDGFSPPSPVPADYENASGSGSDDDQPAEAHQYDNSELGLSDSDKCELESRFESEKAATKAKKHKRLAKPSTTRKARKKQKTRNELKKKKGPKHDLRPQTLTECHDADSVAAEKANSRSTAQDTKSSITVAYAENTKDRNVLFRRKLDQEEQRERQLHHRWVMEQEASQRKQESAQHHELVMALVKQGKSPSEIREYFRITSELVVNGCVAAAEPPRGAFSRVDGELTGPVRNVTLRAAGTDMLDETSLDWNALSDTIDAPSFNV